MCTTLLRFDKPQIDDSGLSLGPLVQLELVVWMAHLDTNIVYIHRQLASKSSMSQKLVDELEAHIPPLILVSSPYMQDKLFDEDT